MNGIRPRWFVQNLESSLRVLPVTVVTGARQTGKTTLVKSLGPARTYLTLDDLGVLDQAEQIDPAWLQGIERIGVTAGASAPEVLVQNVVNRLSGGQTGQASQLQGVEENVTFALPKELQS